MGWQDLPSTMVRVGRQSCACGCITLGLTPLQSEERLRHAIKMHELVFQQASLDTPRPAVAARCLLC